MIAVATIMTLMTLLFAFVLVTISAWNTDSSFTALVQSGLVSAAGRAGTLVRKRAKAEEGNVDDVVADAMGKAEQDASEEA